MTAAPYRQDEEGTCRTCWGSGFTHTSATYGVATRCWVCQGDGWLSLGRIRQLGWDYDPLFYGLDGLAD